MTRSSYRRVFVDGPHNAYLRSQGYHLGVGVTDKTPSLKNKKRKSLNVFSFLALPFIFIASIFSKKG